MPSVPALEFSNVSKQYRGFFRSQWVTALRDFSFRVEPGEIFGFLGPNGAGKTTAIHLAIGLMFPSSGRGEMLGREFGHAPTRRRVGFLAENVALYHRSAEKLVRFYGGLNGMSDPQLRQRTTEMLKELELTEVAGRNAGKFSRGMLQRVGLAQALVNDPELLILDEPASALDPLGRLRVREILQRAREAGKTVFLSSHLLSEVEQICDRLAIVIKGRVARVGTLAELLEAQDRFVITAKGIDALMFEGTSQNGFIKITVPALRQRQTIEKIWLAGGEVVAVNPIRRTLEELVCRSGKPERRGTQQPRGLKGTKMKMWIKALALLSLCWTVRGVAENPGPTWKVDIRERFQFQAFDRTINFRWTLHQGVLFISPERILVYQVNRSRGLAKLSARDASGGGGNFVLDMQGTECPRWKRYQVDSAPHQRGFLQGDCHAQRKIYCPDG